jgi:hypothetical protein
MGIFSCKKDELNSKELLAYLKFDGGNGQVGNINFTRTLTSASGASEIRLSGYLTRETSADVSLSISVDEAKLAEYNAANKTAYVLLPSANYEIENGGSLDIKTGTTVSADSLKIRLKAREQLADPKGYVLPLSITSVNSRDKGIQPSSNYGTVYLVVSAMFDNIDKSSKQPAPGTFIDRKNPAWRIVDASMSYSLETKADAALDGDNNTSWFTSGENGFITVDLAANTVLKGVVLTPNYLYGSYYNATEIEVFISEDNQSWISQGTYVADPVLEDSSEEVPDYRNINFLSPVTCRYIKFVMKEYPNYGGFSEINAIK